MAVEWRIDLYTRARTLLGEISAYRSATLWHQINAPGGCTLPLWYNDVNVPLFEDYGLLDIWRADYAYGLPWYREKTCLIYDRYYVTDEQGDEQFTAVGVGLLAMLDRSIDYPAGSPQATFSGPADTIMCQIVNENAGPLATVANGRRTHGVITDLSIASPAGTGALWEGARMGKPVLEVLNEIANFAGIDFDIEPSTDANGYINGFVFRTYIGQRGIDRSNTGIVPSTGVNASGNAPIIFSTTLDNMALPHYSFENSGSVNRAIVLGDGTGLTRNYDIVESIVYTGDGLDIHEATRDARNEAGVAPNPARIAIGQSIVQSRQARESFEFQPIQLEGCAYGYVLPPLINKGQYYWWGDKVTARAYGFERVKRIVGVKLSVEPVASGLLETPDFTMQDITQRATTERDTVAAVISELGSRLRHLELLE